MKLAESGVMWPVPIMWSVQDSLLKTAFLNATLLVSHQCGYLDLEFGHMHSARAARFVEII